MKKTVVDLVGNTPLVPKLNHMTRDLPGVEIHAKLEYYNPGGSVKDRAALQMLKDAPPHGDKIVIDSTSGNTGIALSWLCAAMAKKVALVMPSNVSAARKRIIKAYGAQIIYSDPLEGSDGAIRHLRTLLDEEPGRYFYIDQYANPSNPRAHMLTTAPEIWEQTQGRVTHFVAGLGTSGTVTGTGRRLHEPQPEDPRRGRRARRAVARPRGPEAHGDVDRARHLRPEGLRREAVDHHR